MDVLTIIVGVIILLLFCLWWNQSVKLANLPPEKRALPIIGNWEIVKRNPRTLRDLGPICTISLFGVKHVLINDWKIVKEALVGQADVFAGRNRNYVSDIVNRQEDLVSIDGPVLKEKRRLAIHALRNLGFGKSTMEDTILDEFTKVQNILDLNNGQKPLSVTGLFFTPTINISWGLINGKSYRYDDDIIKQLTYLVKNRLNYNCNALPVIAMPMLRFLPKDPFSYWKLLRTARDIEDFIGAEVKEHITSFNAENEPRDLVDAYLAEIRKREISLEDSDNKQTAPYNRQHLIGTMTSFLMAGIDTISSTLEWSLLYMALRPEIQKNVQAELDSVIGRDRLVCYADASRLPYTEATLMEVHRNGPTVPLSLPHRTTRATTLATYSIPKDTIIITNLWAVHHDKELWGDPEVFRPDRFLDANGKTVKPDYWIPFSMGPRSCPGVPLVRMQLFLFFASLLQRYTFNCVTGEAHPNLEPETFMSATVAPKPFHLNITKR